MRINVKWGGGGGQQAQDDHNYVWDLTAINWWGSLPPFTDMLTDF